MYFDNTGLAVVGPSEPPPGLVGMETEYIQTQCVLADGGDRFGVSSLTFDRHEELIWMGNQGGHVTSYYTGSMSKYTSFQIHAHEEIRQISTMDEGVLALTASSLRCQIRRGIPVYTHVSSNMQDMQCMLQLSPTRLLIGGHRDKLIDFNFQICKETQVVNVQEGATVMLRPHSRYVCCGSPSGSVELRDPTNLRLEHTIDTHTGSLSDFDVQGNLLVTCGFSNRLGNLAVDRFLMAYDLRMLRAVSPMQTVLDPLYLRFMPSMTSRLVVVSAAGQVQLLDTIALAEPKICLLQVECPASMVLSFDVSSSIQAMAFGDSGGQIHLFSSAEEPIFNNYSRQTEFPDPVTQYPSFAIDDYSTPLSSIPMPYVPPDVPLASDWPAHLIQYAYRKPPGIDPEILRTMKMQGPIGYAPNPKHMRRNQVPYNLLGQNGHIQNSYSNKSPQHHESETNFIAIPKRYRKVDVKYNKLGQDEFQFDNYNKTGLAGLEAVLPNAYCNALIQVLYYIEPLRAALLSHLCNKEFCLSCELGFLFHMLAHSPPSQPCQPGNFLRAFRTVPEAAALGLILSDLAPEAKQKTDLGALIQSWNRFMLHQMHVELNETRKRNEEKKGKNFKSFIYKEIDFPAISKERARKHSAAEVTNEIEEEKREDISEISQIFGIKQMHKHCCLKCSEDVNKGSILLACNLVYPTSEPERDEWTFCDILRRSLCPQQITPAWCDSCGKFTPTSQTRVIESLPKVLSINTGLQSSQHKQFWQTQMDKVVAKISSTDISNNKLTTPTITPTNTPSSKPCRYGDHCSRPGCRFRHSFDNTPAPVPINNPYCSNNWLPHNIKMSICDSKLEIVKIDGDIASEVKNSIEEIKFDPDIDTQTKNSNGQIQESKEYELSAVVCYVNDQKTSDKKNLVALIKVPDSYLKNKELNEHKWYLFNDFSICPVPAQEAVWFSLDWKIPCVLFYSSSDTAEATTEINQPLSREVFNEDNSLARSGGTRGITFTPLNDNEILKAGDLVAMDAEFVTLNQEEAELRSDGKMSTVKPSQMSVARITCIRGQGSGEGTPFIDDYISTQEQVVDYLTKFSGIKPGDLDANFSSKHLTTLKSTYVKLRFLQDSGVVFVGHGLKNDFRVINLVVPADQIVDTVQLFHLRHHRMVSLRFLAWHFLVVPDELLIGLKIQSETHDSIEDARAALQLYKKYQELENLGKVCEALAELYEVGEQLKWKVPEE